MDIDYIKNKIYNPNKSYEESLKIQPGDYISKEVIKMLKDANVSVQLDCFAKADTNNPYTVEIICPKCKKDIIRQLNKTALIEYLRNKNIKRFFCEECERKFKFQQEQRRNKRTEEFEKQKEINTREYIEKYLDPNKTWNANITWKYRFATISNMYMINQGVVASYIKQMPYSDFLKTPYWTAIAMYKKYRSSYKCCMCGSDKNLSTHHNTYENHGYEHKSEVINKDLIVLCQDCHDKLPTSS